uniref:F-box domain-containing protein n=1 Tax=viral metagenome TaxID=1070528 RepID=A0A6C0C9G3_9ZZZZ
MQRIIYGDLLEVLKRSLKPVDLYNLARTCKRYKKSISIGCIKKSTMDEINRRLGIIFGEDLDEFVAIFRNSKAVITGSFITQCMLGEYWKDSNIKIIVNSDELNEPFDHRQLLRPEFQDAKHKFRNDKKIIKYMFFKYRVVEAMPSNHQCMSNIVFEVNETRIMFETAKQHKYDICKNTYDLDGSIFIYKMNEIFAKRANFQPDCIMHMKYRARGFSFYDICGESVTDYNIWKKLDIDFVKITPYDDRSQEKRLQILSNDRNEYDLHKYVISECWAGNLYIVHGDQIPGSHLVSCFRKRITNACLFKEIYPGVEHLHSFDDNKQTLLVINTFDLLDTIH